MSETKSTEKCHGWFSFNQILRGLFYEQILLKKSEMPLFLTFKPKVMETLNLGCRLVLTKIF